MTKWYRACVNYIHSVPEYNCALEQELFTPIFAIARMPGWSAHRLEELTNANKIIRPAYKYVGHHTEFETMEERSAEKITDEDVKEEPEKCKKEEKGKK